MTDDCNHDTGPTDGTAVSPLPFGAVQSELFDALRSAQMSLHHLTEYAGVATTAPMGQQFDLVIDAMGALIDHAAGLVDELMAARARDRDEVIQAKGQAAFLSVAVGLADQEFSRRKRTVNVEVHPVHAFLGQTTEWWAAGGDMAAMPSLP
jgi:hypothetical protein